MNSAGKRSPHNAQIDAERARMLREIRGHAPSKEGAFRKAYTSLSLRKAITAKCLECVFCDTAAIRECPSTACPLWNVRPYQITRKANPEKAKSHRDTAEVNRESATTPR